MNKRSFEIIMSLASVAIFVFLIVAAKLILPESAGFGYAVALLVFIVIMGIVGLKLAEMPEK